MPSGSSRGEFVFVLISGIVVQCHPQNLNVVRERVSAFPWADVHHEDPKGRLVVTIEAVDAEASIECVLKIQDTEDVVMAEMAEFCVEELT